MITSVILLIIITVDTFENILCLAKFNFFINNVSC